MPLPDLYLVSAPKAGTTTVARWLSAQPDVYWSVPKEPYYWATDYPRLRAHYGFDERAAYERLYSSESAARARFRGDGSTTYLYSSSAVPHICEAAPDARFLVCVRSPVDLVISYHRTQLTALNEDERDFATAGHRHLEGILPDTDPLDEKLVDYAQVGAVGEAMEQLLRVMPRDRVHAVVFDDLAHDPAGTWRSLAEYVGIDPAHEPSFAASNPSDKAARWPALRRLMHRPPTALEPGVRRLRQWSRTTRTPGVATLKRRMWRPVPRPAVGPQERRELADYFKADVGLLSEILRRDLSHWSA